MIDLHGQISAAFVKKSRFTGSFQGMRYLLQKAERAVKGAEGEQDKAEKAAETVLEAVIWPEPFSFEKTEDEKKHGRDFPLSEEGLWEAVDWLNEEFLAGHF